MHDALLSNCYEGSLHVGVQLISDHEKLHTKTTTTTKNKQKMIKAAKQNRMNMVVFAFSSLGVYFRHSVFDSITEMQSVRKTSMDDK